MTTSVDTGEVAEGEMGPTESFGFFLKMMNFVTGINTHIMFYVDRDAPTGRENMMRGCKQVTPTGTVSLGSERGWDPEH